MCGITGYYCHNNINTNVLDKDIKAMTDSLYHRGPDDYGYYKHSKIALGHRRLSIIDLKTGHQPIFNEDKSMCIVYNGEVFNFKEINIELKNKGHVFSTESDTETIIHAYEEWGEECMKKFRGMFAFAIWDSIHETLFIARDRVGIKPLFYAQSGDKFLFSSEMKSILSNSSFDRSIDEEALISYFMFSYIPAPMTIYKNIKKLLPGHYMKITNGKIETRQYWDLIFQPDRKKKEKDFIMEYMHLLKESVRIRMISDVPLGGFLSGGIDSSTVIALMSKENNEPINSFTIGFGGNISNFDDERKYARLVAERYRTNHREYELFPKVEGLMEKIVRAFDEPFGDDSTVPTYMVCKMARESVTVALSGLGGDENFAGYDRYLGFLLGQGFTKLPAFMKIYTKYFLDQLKESNSWGNEIHQIKRFTRSLSENPAERYLGYITKINGKYMGNLFSDNIRHFKETIDKITKGVVDIYDNAKADDPLNKILYIDIKSYLPDDILACTDRMSMCNSLEVRVPFLDHKLMEYCAQIPPEMKIKWLQKKYLLKKGVSGLLPKKILKHRKQGFVGPMKNWLKDDLRDITKELLSEKSLDKHGYFYNNTIRNIIEEHHQQKENNDTVLWSLLMFQMWHKMYIEEPNRLSA